MVNGAARSALQKYVRRGMVDLAAATAQLLEDEGDIEGVGRRLTAMCAEDVEPLWLPEVCTAWVDAMAPVAGADLISLVPLAARLAAAGKNRDAAWLSELVWEGRTPATIHTWPEIARAVEDRDYKQVTAALFEANDARRLVGAGGLGRALEDLATTDRTLDVVRWGVWRATKGGAGSGEALASVAIALIDQPGEAPEMPLDDYEVVPVPDPLDWFAFDMHTRIGKIAIGSYAKKHDFDATWLGHLQFYFESAKVGPIERTSARFKEPGELVVGHHFGWGTPEAGERMWLGIRDDFRGLVEWLQRRNIR